jgi:hypothetical protein
LGLLSGAGGAHATFPGENGKIAFQSRSDQCGGCPWSLLTVQPDGSGRTVLVDRGQEPAWSADGERVAFNHDLDIFVLDAHGSRNLTGTSTVTEADPTWSPDGTKIAFTRNVPGVGFFGAFEIFVMNADGSDQTRLTRARDDGVAFHSYEPTWSPDGARIAFTRTIFPGDGRFDEEIYVMNRDGSGVERLTFNHPPGEPSGGAYDIQPDWSPDGELIAFESRRGGPADVYLMRPDGTGLTRLTEHPARDAEPSWSPDGAKIAFVDSFGQLSIMNRDGSGRRNLTNAESLNEREPSWQPLNRPPDCSGVTATPASLTAADRRLRLVSLAGGVDPDGDAVSLTITGVTQDEPLKGGEDRTAPDAFSRQLTREPSVAALLDNEPNEVYLRAERRNSGDGRVYRIAFTGSDGRGGSCAATAKVSVPRRGTAATDSAPPSYDSFAP